MKILSNFLEFQKALKLIYPQRIAVAYLGEDYSEFIDPQELKEIIVSPTIGSNPQAISEMVKTISWQKVHFLKKLHSKIYLGKQGAIIGSANLSRNALGINGLYEVGVLIEDKKIIDQLEKVFENYKTKAKINYTSIIDKKEALQKLFRDHNSLPKKYKYQGGRKLNKHNTFKEYDYDSDQQFKITWYDVDQTDKSMYDKSTYIKSFPGQSFDEIYNNIYQELEVAHNENIRPGDWILCFKMNRQDKAIITGLEWMFVDYVLKNAYKQEDLPDSIMESEKDSKKGRPPFIINSKFKEAFVRTINRPKYKIFRNPDNMLFINNSSFYRSLWNDVKKAL